MKAFEKAIVKVGGDISMADALLYVGRVIRQGRISKATVNFEEFDCYCYHTGYENTDTGVETHVLVTPNSPNSHTFQVWRTSGDE